MSKKTNKRHCSSVWVFTWLFSNTAFLLLAISSPYPAAGYDLTNPYNYGSAGRGAGSNGQIGSGNANESFAEEYGNSYTVNPNSRSVTGMNAYDQIPVKQLNSTNVDGSGQQIFDYYPSTETSANNTQISQKQIPIGRNGTNVLQGPGLMPAYTALQAGAIPGAIGRYSFTQIPSGTGRHHLTYGFDGNSSTANYTGLAHPNEANMAVPSTQFGGSLPAVSTGSVDLNVVSGTNMRIKPRAPSSPSYLIP